MFQLTNTSESSKLQGVKMLVYGKAGVGKTRLCATAPAPIILSAEAGLLSLASFNLPVITIATIDDLTEVYNWLANSNEANQYKTVCLDSITEVGEVVLASAMKIDPVTGKKPDGRQAYGELIQKMTHIIKCFRDLTGKHVYFSAKQEYITDESNGTTSYGPSMPGKKLAQGLPFFFDECFQLEIGKAQDQSTFRYLRTQPDFNHSAKDRSGVLEAVEAPDLSNIINKISAVHGG